MAKLHSELVLGLTDNASGPARRINQNLENMRNQQMRTQQTFERHRNVMAGSAIAAYALSRAIATPVQASIEFSTQLEDIRQKADLSTEAIERLGRSSRDIGIATAQGAGSITGAIDSMVGSGSVTPDQAVAISTPLGKAASAYGADPVDMAGASSAMIEQLGISADEIEKAYDIMAVGGKAGAFELKAMAAEFPGVLAQAKSLGIEGEKGLASIVAWLQISQRGTGLDSSAAANNMSNFMGKIMSPDAIKNFGEAGVDIVAEMARATEAGVDPIEHAVGIINGLTEGQRAKLGELFADKQVTDFLLQATKGIEDYRKIRDDALAADGTVEKDFQARLLTPAGAIARFEASIENLNIAIGNSLVPALADFARSVTPMIDGVSSFVDANGELVAAVVEITAALVGLRLLASAGGMGGALLGMSGSGGGDNSKNGAGGGPGGSSGRNGKGAAWWGFAGFNAFDMLQEYGSAAESMVVRQPGQTDEAWAAQTKPLIDAKNLRDAETERALRSFDIGGFKPFKVIDAIANPQGGIGGGYTGATQGQIDALKAEIATLDAEMAEWPEDGMEARRAGLAEKLTSMQSELKASGATMVNEFAATMERMRAMAAQGIKIPMSLGGTPAIPNIGAMSPPSGPRIGPQAAGGPATQTITFGDINLKNSTNASPHEISRALGQHIGDRLRASHSNGSMT